MSRLWTGRPARWAAAIVAAAALTLFWTSVWRDLDRTVLTRVAVLDEAYYLRQAAGIVDGRLLPDDPFVMSPLYPYLVAATGSGREVGPDRLRTGPPPHGIRGLQVLLWLGTALLLWRVARRLCPARFAWLAPALFLLYRPGAIFVTSVLLEVPLTFLSVAALAVATGGKPSPRRAVAAGLLIGAAALLRAHAVLLVLPAALALSRDGAGPLARLRGWRRTAPLALAAVLMLMPVSFFNSIRAGRPVGTSLNGGINLFIGNGPPANGYFLNLRGYKMSEDPTGARVLAARRNTPPPAVADADRIWAREAWRSITEDPARAAGLWLKKVRLYWVAREFPQISQLSSWVREAPLLGLLAAPYGLVAAGGLLGLLLVGFRDRRLRPWSTALLLLIAAQSVFFVVTRYRLVLVPLLSLLAAAGAADLWARRGRRRWTGGLAVVAAVLAVWPWGLGGISSRLEAAGLLNEGVRWEHMIDESPLAFGRAADLYAGSIAADPRLPEPYRALARLHRNAGRADDAEGVLREGLAAASLVADLRNDLIRLLLEEGRAAEALPPMRDRLRDDPDDAGARHDLIVGLATAGLFAEAETLAVEFTRLAPDDPRAPLDLGVVVAHQGRLEEAYGIFREGAARFPDHGPLRANLERLAARLEK